MGLVCHVVVIVLTEETIVAFCCVNNMLLLLYTSVTRHVLICQSIMLVAAVSLI